MAEQNETGWNEIKDVSGTRGFPCNGDDPG